MIKSNIPLFDKPSNLLVGVDFYCNQYLCCDSLNYIYICLTDQENYVLQIQR